MRKSGCQREPASHCAAYPRGATRGIGCFLGCLDGLPVLRVAANTSERLAQCAAMKWKKTVGHWCTCLSCRPVHMFS